MNEQTFKTLFPNASRSLCEANRGLLDSTLEDKAMPQDQSPAVPKGNTKFEMKSERELQGQIVNLLRLRGIEVLWHRTDKRSAATVGWPDLTFCAVGDIHDEVTEGSIIQIIEVGPLYPCAWEVKLPGKKLSPEQEALKPKLEVNGWKWRMITSVDMALAELKAMGIE